MVNTTSQASWWYDFSHGIAYHFFTHAFDTEARYLSPIPSTGGLLVVSNHLSFLDPPVVAAFLKRPVYFVARKTLFRHPLFARLISSLHAFPIDQDNPDIASLRRILKHLDEGHAVLLFPEGSRSMNGLPQPPQPGVGWIALKARVPILPVKIKGTFEILPRGRTTLKYHPLKITYGTPRPLPAVFEQSKGKDTYFQIAQYLMQEIAALP
ncbi:MAG: lysophospholipid acyltransferase family protein [Verrucomicrobiae bacterium]|nr:lysophospholipid acyltransferase family protein [Verrucomicrobiae bacterium]